MNERDTPDVRAAIVGRAITRPDRRSGPGFAFEPVPGGRGVVPVTGAPDEARDRWVLEGTSITVAELRAAADLIRTAGLGSVAAVMWMRPGLDGAVRAWGPTAREAVGNAVAGVRDLWNQVDPALADAVFARAWARGERRTTANGMSIIASASDPFGTVLEARRGYAELRLRVAGGPDRRSTLRAATDDVHPLPLAIAFARVHTARGFPPGLVWPSPGVRTVGTGTVLPAAPATAVPYALPDDE